MKRRFFIIVGLIILSSLSGCRVLDQCIENAGVDIESLKNTTEYVVQTDTDVNDGDILENDTNRMSETDSTEEMNMMDETNTKNEMTENKPEKDAEPVKYKGKKYTFYKVDDSLYEGGCKIRSVYEEYTSNAAFHGMFVGQVVTMFGDENVTGDNESLISYIVAAEDEDGNVIYLEVYYGPSGPAIGGWEEAEYLEAAEELENIIRKVVPIDYECKSVYYDVGVTIRMGTKDGVGFYESDF